MYRRESTWRGFANLPFVGDPVVREFRLGEPVEVHTHYKVSIDVPSMARRFIDPDKLTFVEITRLGADGSGTFKIVPDHYSKLLRSSGTVETIDAGDTCERRIAGEVDVSLGWAGMLFEQPVEEAIVGGLQRALEAQAEQLQL